MLRISQIKINISEFYKKHRETIHTKADWREVFGSQEARLVKRKAASLLGCSQEDIKKLDLVKRSIDSRKKSEICYNYSVDVQLSKSLEQRLLKREKKKRFVPSPKNKYVQPEIGELPCSVRPIIVGFGPAGMFCALELAKAGFRPVVLERGQDVDTRKRDVEAFWNGEELRGQSNVQFGEGGAGTFSDGKLNTTVKDPSGRNRKVLEIFVEHGADPEILYQQKPHLGTDELCTIVKNIRQDIIEHGGEVRFGSQLTDIHIDAQGCLDRVQVNGEEWLPAQVVVLAVGHSARDTFQVLYRQKVAMEAKAFAIGVRVEHPQIQIDENQYGELAPFLPAADYKLTYQASTGRSVFSFCMCPGGFVVNASSEPEHLVVNGMSNRGRAEENANSALIVNVTPEDFEGQDVLAGVAFQRKWEHLAYTAGNGKIPVQLFGDFKKKQKSTAFGKIHPVHKGQDTFANLWDCLPDYVCETLVEGITYFGTRIDGYDEEDVILSGVETRTSSPIRINRSDTLESNVSGLYPCGEGAGYAGGITSAAMDGLRVYEAICKRYRPGTFEHEV